MSDRVAEAQDDTVVVADTDAVVEIDGVGDAVNETETVLHELGEVLVVAVVELDAHADEEAVTDKDAFAVIE